ncbi:cucumber peeling cupredoxin-like [Carya illinoinensis]|uniref:cucumber peeling cupredoxin-like n=1 Tax=Carya illinoinensis TaxID=32201 RepID=UPI001C71CE3F|nr:cucumber peeling cupredoxin-like [Carya illinoinensis]
MVAALACWWVQFFCLTSGCSPAAGCPSACSATSVRYYQVGSVWSIPPSPSYYANWSSSNFFRTVDFLSFNFQTGENDVIHVSRHEYESCTACNPFKVMNFGPANFPLTEQGVFYFISNFSNYCALGLKVSVKVHGCSSINGSQYAPSPSPSSLPAPPSPSPSRPAPPRARDGSNKPPVPSPAPSPNYGYPPEVGASSTDHDKSMATLERGRFGVGSFGILFRLAFEICLAGFVILG